MPCDWQLCGDQYGMMTCRSVPLTVVQLDIPIDSQQDAPMIDFLYWPSISSLNVPSKRHCRSLCTHWTIFSLILKMFTVLHNKITRDSSITAIESDHKICPYCNHDYFSNEANFCPKCGGELVKASVHGPQHKENVRSPKQTIIKAFRSLWHDLLSPLLLGFLIWVLLVGIYNWLTV